MNRNFYMNIILTVLTLVVLFCGYALIRAVDLLRLRTEKISIQIGAVEKRLNVMEKPVSSPTSAHLRPPAAAPEANREGARDSSDAKPMANAEFYDPAADPGDRLITAIMSETKNMNYIINNEAFVGSLWSYTNDSLADRNFEHPEIFSPQLAESWQLSEDKMVYTIKLREGVLWHDFKDPVSGKEWKEVEVTADDFKFYLDVVRNQDVDCAPVRAYLQDLDRIEVLSKYEFKVYWRKKYFLSESITLGLSPLPKHLYHAYAGPFDGKKFNDDHERNRLIVGCGPYCFLKWDKGQKIILKRWDKYYGRRHGVMPPLEQVAFEVIMHPNTQFQDLKSGGIDRMMLTPEQWVNKTDIPEFEPKTGSLKKLQYSSRNYNYIGYNQTNPLFQDKLVRQALTHLVDRSRILKDVYYGLGRVVTGPFYIDTPYYDKSVEPYPFSIEKARDLFRQAGWTDTDGDGILDKDGTGFEFTILSIASSKLLPKILEICKEDMAKAGVVMKIVNVEWSVYTQRLEQKKFEVCVLGWSLGFDNDPYQLWHSNEADKLGSSNHIGFKNPEADRLIEEIRVCFDLDKRIELCRRFHRLLHEEQPYTFLVSADSLVAQSSRFRNVHVFPVGLVTRIMWTPLGEQQAISN